MNILRSRRLYAFAAPLLVGVVAAGSAFAAMPRSSVVAHRGNDAAAMAGIEKLHQLDQKVTLLNSPKALQEEWAKDAIRLEPGSPPDIGKAAIYASDVRSFVQAPGAAIVSYQPMIRNVQVVGDWAFEWGLFTVGYRSGANTAIATLHGEFLRVLHKEDDGKWRFARVMAAVDSKRSNTP